ncbi:hypothetical protein [Thauera sinica]|uniref:Uncharacterized protein n=1 Tax=Thauera sinica TaxID=2665146 RepID=A0ABW1AKS0_9RHOO|nr:hypothetical protein [Thauera sp. K11]
MHRTSRTELGAGAMLGGNLSRVTRAIQGYFASHPDAADSAEGIARWWLVGEGVVASEDEVKAALCVLVERGLVLPRRMPDGRLIYAWAGGRDPGGTH